MSTAQFDVVIAGAGVAGASVAAALSEFGYRVLVAEPGLDASKRLAGELIHPPGVSALDELGLLGALEQVAVRVFGFAVFPNPFTSSGDGADTSEEQARLLPYGEIPGVKRLGFALEHAQLRERLLGALAALPHVTIAYGARIIALELGDDAVRVRIAELDGEFECRARLLVAADGGSSQVSRMAGIGQDRTRISTMLGYTLENAELPHPGFGHVFLGGPGLVLAYATARNVVRVLFDVTGEDGENAIEHDPAYRAALPASLQESLRRAIHVRRPLVSASYLVVPEAVVRKRLALVGDAAGCCHPLTATGLTACTRDALRLRQAIRETNGDLSRALGLYARLHGGSQRTRLALAIALYETFKAPTPELRLLRQGLLSYWADPRNRAASMALLSTCDDRLSVLARQFAKVMLSALTAPLPGVRGRVPAIAMRSRAIFSWGYQTGRFIRQAVKIG